MQILGILNITEDSFSDGGKFLAPDAALAQGHALLKDGADILDIGAASSNPESKPVPVETEIARLGSVIPPLKAEGSIISIDSFSAEVQRWALGQGALLISTTFTALPNPRFIPNWRVRTPS